MAQIEFISLDSDLQPAQAGLVRAVKIGGAMDAASVENDANLVQPELAKVPNGGIIIFMFSDLVYLNSRAIGYLINWHLEMEKKGSQVFFCELKPNVQDIMETTGLTQIFPVYMTFDEAKLAAITALEGRAA